MNYKIFSLIAGVLTVILFWIGWVSLNPSDKKAMAQFVSVEKLVNNEISSRTKLGGIVKKGSFQFSKSNK